MSAAAVGVDDLAGDPDACRAVRPGADGRPRSARISIGIGALAAALQRRARATGGRRRFRIVASGSANFCFV